MANLPYQDFGAGNYSKGFQGFGNSASGASGLNSFLYSLFGDREAPFREGAQQIQQATDKAVGVQQPFYQAGTQAIPQYQNWLQNMQNPSQFVNNLESQYSESPHARYLQDQAMRAAQNAGSAGGLTGSTPLAQQMAQTSAGIAGQDMNSWLQNVLGINTLYGTGQQNLMGFGANAANQQTSAYTNLGKQLADMKAAQAAAHQQDVQGGISGGISTALGLIGL